MKQLFLIIALALSICVYSQEEIKSVKLTVSGQGKTPEEAKQIALRSAIEQAFGTYISSNTTILNDSIIRDEIISVANGNIEKFEILSEVKLPNGSYASSIKAVVSISKLTNFCESKGVTVTLKGGLFAANIKQQQLNEKNEVSSIKLLSETAKSLIDNMFDYSLTSSEPISIYGNEDLWALHLSVGVKVNENFLALKKCLFNTLASLCLTGTEANDYIKMGKPVYQINFEINDTLKGPIYLRSEKSTAILQDLTWYFYYSQSNFVIKDGIRDYPFDMLGGGGEYEYPISEENKVILEHDNQTSRIYYQSMNGIILQNRTWSICLTDLYNPPQSFKRTTYALEKKNIYENTHNYYNPQSWDSEENLADKAEELRYFKKICADSVTCFTYFDEAVRYGFPRGEYAGSGGQHYFGFNLNPPKNEYGKFSILLKYNTDELAKITALTVKPYLTLMQRKY